MKKLLIGTITLTSISSMACNFQEEKSDIVKAKKIKCNEVTLVATIERPKIEINGKFYNLGGSYSVKEEYWDTDTKNYSSRSREKVVIDRKLKNRKVGRWISNRSQHRICQLFSFSRAVNIKSGGMFSYFKKAYWFDHDELFKQSLNYAPIINIKCR